MSCNIPKRSNAELGAKELCNSLIFSKTNKPQETNRGACGVKKQVFFLMIFVIYSYWIIQYTHMLTIPTCVRADYGKNNSLISKQGPQSICQTNSTGLERTEIRDIICSNLNKSNNDTEPNILPMAQRDKTNIMFYHIPKTGGESLEAMLGIIKNHDTFLERTKERKNIGKRSLSITIVRNPYDRMLSWFRFCLHGYHGSLPTPIKHCLLAHQYINQTADGRSHNSETVSTAFESWLVKIFLSPELSHSWVTSTYQDFLGGTSPLHLDYIIRFEHYAEDFALLAEALGFKNIEIQKENGSKEGDTGIIDSSREHSYGAQYNPQVAELLRNDYRDIYTKKARTLMEMVFEDDLHYFNYTF